MSGAKLIERHLASKDAKISRLQSRIEELEKRLKPFADKAASDTIQVAHRYDQMLTISNGECMCGIDPIAFIEARSVLEASHKGGE